MSASTFITLTQNSPALSFGSFACGIQRGLAATVKHPVAEPTTPTQPTPPTRHTRNHWGRRQPGCASGMRLATISACMQALSAASAPTSTALTSTASPPSCGAGPHVWQYGCLPRTQDISWVPRMHLRYTQGAQCKHISRLRHTCHT